MGLNDDRNYARYHEVLNRVVWSPYQAPRILLMLLQHLDQGDGPLVFGILGLCRFKRTEVNEPDLLWRDRKMLYLHSIATA